MRSTYNLTKEETIVAALNIAREYRQQGMTLTLRQMYYQFVARGLETNGQKVYKRLGNILVEARFNGHFPIEYLEDRGRSSGTADWTTYDVDVDTALDQCTRYVKAFPSWTINTSRWWGQDALVSVWVEKEALSGVFEGPCSRLGVPLFACKGYPSVSTLAAWHNKIVQARQAFEDEGLEPPNRAVILYFGDHDPDGWEIPRSSRRNLKRLQELDGEYYAIEFVRCALNMDQIEQYNPPPFPAKMTSSRYAGYIEEHDTDDAWELDALEPTVLRRLIEDSVDAYFDEDTYDVHQELVRERREELATRLPEII